MSHGNIKVQYNNKSKKIIEYSEVSTAPVFLSFLSTPKPRLLVVLDLDWLSIEIVIQTTHMGYMGIRRVCIDHIGYIVEWNVIHNRNYHTVACHASPGRNGTTSQPSNIAAAVSRLDRRALAFAVAAAYCAGRNPAARIVVRCGTRSATGSLEPVPLTS